MFCVWCTWYDVNYSIVIVCHMPKHAPVANRMRAGVASGSGENFAHKSFAFGMTSGAPVRHTSVLAARTPGTAGPRSARARANFSRPRYRDTAVLREGLGVSAWPLTAISSPCWQRLGSWCLVQVFSFTCSFCTIKTA